MTLLLHLLSIPVAYAYVVSLEWAIHRYIFHGIGKRWKPLGFHWHQHHRAALQNQGLDPSYDGSVFAWSAHGREFWAIIVGLVVHGLVRPPDGHARARARQSAAPASPAGTAAPQPVSRGQSPPSAKARRLCRTISRSSPRCSRPPRASARLRCSRARSSSRPLASWWPMWRLSAIAAP